MLISGTSSANGGASSLLGSSKGSYFDGSMNIASRSSIDTSSGIATINTCNTVAGSGRLSGDSLFSTGSVTSGNSGLMSIVSGNGSAGVGGRVATLVGSTDSGNIRLIMLSAGLNTGLDEVGDDKLINTGSSVTGVGGGAMLPGRLSGSNSGVALSATASSSSSRTDGGATLTGRLSALEAEETSATFTAKENLVDVASMLGGRSCALLMMSGNASIN